MNKKTAGDESAELSWADIGFILEGFSFAARPLHRTTQAVTEEYSLGPRGAWMVLLIARGGLFPMDLTNIFEVGRSLITAELNRLLEAGLITYKKHGSDGRRVELALTALGEKINRRAKADLTALVRKQLKSYTRDEILLCARMLRDFRRTHDEAGAERYEQWSDDQLAALAEETRRPAPKKAPARSSRAKKRSR
jgi:DNA-binding MarR family transcriptional regulator